MNTNQLVFQLLFYILIFYIGLCLVFFLCIGTIQTQVYENIVQDKVRPDILKILREKDSNGEIKEFSKSYSSTLRDLSIQYSNSSNSNSRMNIVLISVGVLLGLSVLISGYMLYRNGTKEMIWNALGFYFLMVCFGIYFFIRVLSRYSSILPSKLIEEVFKGGERLVD